MKDGESMDTVVRFIAENESIIMSALFIMILILTAAVFVTDIISKKQIDKNKEQKENELDKTKDFVDIKEIIEDKPIEIKYVEDDEELEKTRAQEELKNLKEELIKADKLEKEQKAVKIDEVEEKEQSSIEKFESEQEENAIISLEEFNKVSDKVYDQNEITQYKDDGNEPISIQELEELYRSAKEIEQSNEKKEEMIVKPSKPEIEKKEEVIEEKNVSLDEFKFKSSPIISPVFGIGNDNEKMKENISLENTANLDKLNEEIRKTNEFLSMLRELRKKLE